MPLNKERVQADLEALHDIGKDHQGGITRLAYSTKDNDSHQYLEQQMQKEGFFSRYDPVRNLYIAHGNGIRHKIVLGSHLDSVPNGGNYDGVVGNITSAEILRVIKEDHVKLYHDIEMVIFRGEESSRFSKAMIGSSAVTGTLTDEDLKLDDKSTGRTLAEAIQKAGGSLSRLDEAVWDPERVSFYFEDHIEQGRVLKDKEIGIITGIAAPVRYWIHLYGRKDHSGNTPMDMRLDPMDAFFEIGILKTQTMERALSNQYPTVATIGDVNVPEGSMNAVPGHVQFCLDLRDINIQRRDYIESYLMNGFHSICNRRGIVIKKKEVERKNPAFLTERIYNVTEQVCKDLGIKYQVMHSGAGHDGLPLSHFGIPTGMIFIPSKDGLSHQKGEFSTIDDIMLGAQVKYETILRLDKILS